MFAIVASLPFQRSFASSQKPPNIMYFFATHRNFQQGYQGIRKNAKLINDIQHSQLY